MERSAVSFNPGSDYLYAIVHGLPRGWRPPAEGIGGAPVRTVPVRDVVVVASHLATPVSRTPLNQAVHADVVEVAARAQSVLPFAFGTVLPQALEPWVCARLPLVRASLRRLRGAVEMQVRLVSLDACPRDLEALARRLVDAAGVPTWAYREA
ncbi:MAG: GvpL/GvpF family gas vesicle protein, partial [Candidatus Rokubacteria bacterium]|nr:GvpL/GvpF family gas vesicle protein [Candidatus Rokubacteria bacterium]